jgi:hypothetical protein
MGNPIEHAWTQESTCIPHHTAQRLHATVPHQTHEVNPSQTTCTHTPHPYTPSSRGRKVRHSPPPQGSARASSSLRRRAVNGGSQNSADSTTAAPSRTAAAQRHHRRRPRPSSPPPSPPPSPPAESGGSPATFPIAQQQIRSPRHPRRRRRHSRAEPTNGWGLLPLCSGSARSSNGGEREKDWGWSRGGGCVSERARAMERRTAQRGPRRRGGHYRPKRSGSERARVLPRVKSRSAFRGYRQRLQPISMTGGAREAWAPRVGEVWLGSLGREEAAVEKG